MARTKAPAKPGAGYSGTPLAQKLGIKEGHRLFLLGAPPGFAARLAPLPPVRLLSKLEAPVDVAVMFCTTRGALQAQLAELHAALAPAGGLWVAWPKKAAAKVLQLPTDMTEDVVREVALPRGLVDNKVCAIDEIWSGLRLVIRKALR